MPSTNCFPLPGRVCLLVTTLVVSIIAIGCEKVSPPAENTANVELGEQTSDGELVFDPRVAIPKSFPAIVTPETSTAEQADQELLANELVLGVEVNGEARAYPINMLSGPQREIVNDKLGGMPIAATW